MAIPDTSILLQVAQSLKCAVDMAFTIKNTVGNSPKPNTPGLAAASNSLHSELLSLQALATNLQFLTMDLLSTNSALYKENKELREKDGELARHKPYQLQSGAIVYVLKMHIEGQKPEYHACPTCMADGKLSILQDIGTLWCHRCSFQIGYKEGSYKN